MNVLDLDAGESTSSIDQLLHEAQFSLDGLSFDEKSSSATLLLEHIDFPASEVESKGWLRWRIKAPRRRWRLTIEGVSSVSVDDPSEVRFRELDDISRDKCGGIEITGTPTCCIGFKGAGTRARLQKSSDIVSWESFYRFGWNRPGLS